MNGGRDDVVGLIVRCGGLVIDRVVLCGVERLLWHSPATMTMTMTTVTIERAHG